MVLANIKPGIKIKLLKVQTDLAVRSRLSAMGLVLGSAITVIRNDTLGPVIIALKGSRLILGKGLASKIKVEIINEKTN